MIHARKLTSGSGDRHIMLSPALLMKRHIYLQRRQHHLKRLCGDPAQTATDLHAPGNLLQNMILLMLQRRVGEPSLANVEGRKAARTKRRVRRPTFGLRRKL